MTHDYEKLDPETGKIKWCPPHDADAKITGKHIIGLKAWFDENPEERIRLGWVKHLKLTQEELKEQYPYNAQTQYRLCTTRQVDPWTIQDEYHIIDKTEELMLLEEMLEVAEPFWSDDIYETGIHFMG